tara:strand:+ start:596 stop:2665 length:2070 start_codon:yes stop_codon:yes gene_type:complete
MFWWIFLPCFDCLGDFMRKRNVLMILGWMLSLPLLMLGCQVGPGAGDEIGVMGKKLVGDCSVTLSADKTSPQASGVTVSLTASATCKNGAAAEYKFYQRGADGKWIVAQDWSDDMSFDWDTSSASTGDYLFQVWTRRKGETISYEGTSSSLPFEITGGTIRCNDVSVVFDPTSPQEVGENIELTFLASCTGTATPEFKVYLKQPSGEWSLERDWNTSTQFAWDTSTFAAGDYAFQIWVRRKNSTAAYEGASTLLAYKLTSSVPNCTSPTVQAEPNSPQPQGVQVVFEADAPCVAGGIATYKFYVRDPAGNWTLAQDWSTSATLNWDTSNAQLGSYLVQVWSRADGSNENYQGVSQNFSFEVNQGATVSTLAGDSSSGYNDATGSSARFDEPGSVAKDAAGNLYIADTNNHRIRKVTPTGIVTTVAGDGSAGFADSTLASSSFNSPRGIVASADGNTLYVSDTGNHRIRKIDIQDNSVTTIAGSGTAGFTDATGVVAQFDQPHGIGMDNAGNLYIADTNNHRIRKITPAGVVTTFAGIATAGHNDATGAAAQFNQPWGLAVDGSGNVYVADTGNHRIRKITSAGVVTTVAGIATAGFSDGRVSVARLDTPTGLAVDAAGALYITDTGNHRIRKLTTQGILITIGGKASADFSDGIGTNAGFDAPTGIAVDGNGNIYVADTNNHALRKLTP